MKLAKIFQSQLFATIAASIAIFLFFFGPITTLGVFLTETVADAIVSWIVKSSSPSDIAALNKQVAIERIVGGTTGSVFIIIIFLILLLMGFWLSRVLANLARALGYRSSPFATASDQLDDQVFIGRDKGPEQLEEGSVEGGLTRTLYLSEKPLLGIQNARNRLATHVVGLRNASILNLFAGIFVAAVGILVLYSVFVDISSFGVLTERKINPTEFVIFTLVPRISATLFIQVFAYFFLLMYRSNLADIRYFQNEMSNLDIYGTAISIALRPDLSATQKSVVLALLRIERNRFVNKNQKVANPSDDSEMQSKLVASLTKVVDSLSAVVSKSKKSS